MVVKRVERIFKYCKRKDMITNLCVKEGEEENQDWKSDNRETGVVTHHAETGRGLRIYFRNTKCHHLNTSLPVQGKNVLAVPNLEDKKGMNTY